MRTFLTQDRPGIGGRLRETPEDFVVVERLTRPPRGKGANVWILVEKRGISTPELLRRLATAVSGSAREFRAAGYKDAAAITRQWVSAPAKYASPLANATIADVAFLDSGFDDAPLDSSFIAENSFRIVARDVEFAEQRLSLAEETLRDLVKRGVPNFYGPQRFGVRGESAEVGALLLVGRLEPALDLVLGKKSDREHDPRAARFRDAYDAGDFAAALAECPGALRLERRLLEELAAGKRKRDVARMIPAAEQRFFVSAWQSLLFNRVLARRLEEDAFSTVLRGDILIDDAGVTTHVLDPAPHRGATGNGRLHPTAPLFGERMALATGEPGRWELDILRRAGFDSLAALRANTEFPFSLQGDRRSCRAMPKGASVRLDGPTSLCFEFALPSGAFATTLLFEVMKTESPVV